jgi:hypothetical protein
MKRIILAVAIALSGCANQPISFTDGSPVPKERLYSHSTPDRSALLVTRDSGPIGVALNTDLYIDGVLAGSFESGEAARFWVTPGDHIVAVKNMGSTPIERMFSVKPDTHVKLRIVVTVSGIDIMPTAF